MNLKSKLPPKFQKYASFGIFPKLIFLPFALGFIALILLLRPFVVIKFFKVNQWRIGHLLAEVEIARINALGDSTNKKNYVIYYFPEQRVANEYVVQMWKRVLPNVTGSWGWILYALATNLPLRNLIVKVKVRDEFGRFILSSPNWEFTPEEIVFGQKFLNSVGCVDNNFVCLMVRDSTYLKTIRSDKSFDFYKYRDSDISTYVFAAEALTKLGYIVFRMGQIVKDPIYTANPKIIDYATNGMRSEFLDVYLGANCKFCVSTGTGWDCIPQLFRRPMMYLNVVGFSEDLITNPFIIYPKTYKDLATNAILTLSQIAERGIANEVRSPAIDASETVIEDLSAESIRDAVLEMTNRLKTTMSPSHVDELRKNRIIEIFRKHQLMQVTQNQGDLRGQFASCFLSRYPNFLD